MTTSVSHPGDQRNTLARVLSASPPPPTVSTLAQTPALLVCPFSRWISVQVVRLHVNEAVDVSHGNPLFVWVCVCVGGGGRGGGSINCHVCCSREVISHLKEHRLICAAHAHTHTHPTFAKPSPSVSDQFSSISGCFCDCSTLISCYLDVSALLQPAVWVLRWVVCPAEQQVRGRRWRSARARLWTSKDVALRSGERAPCTNRFLQL